MQPNVTIEKNRLSRWPVAAVLLLVMALGIGALKFISSKSAASDSPRDYQATPDATVRAMFGMLDQFKYKFSTAHLLSGKERTPDEQRFAELFWDNQRSDVFYSVLIDREPELQDMSLDSIADPTATVKASVKAFAKLDYSEKTDRLYFFELRKRGANWYIYELRGNQSPAGVFETFQKATAR